jgi:hypothetical protein
MNPDNPYLRRIEVLIGPLPEWQGGGDPEKAIRIIADGSLNRLRVNFNVYAAVPSTGSPTIVKIYNLGEKLRSILARGQQLVLRAGWENTGVSVIFSGGILNATHVRENADIVTTIAALPAIEGLYRTVVSQSFSGGVSLQSIVKTLATKIPGIKIDAKSLIVPDVKLGNQGLSLAGPVKDQLDKLARVYAFNWWIDRGVFKALPHMSALAGSVAKISWKNGFLIRAEPILMTPIQRTCGVSIHAILNPIIEAGGQIELESKLNEKLNGTHPVMSLCHSGDSHSSQWTTYTQTWWGYKG